MPAERFTVRITKDDLVFSSGHFITYDGDHCERLHGHNYRAAVTVEGPLDANHYVFDFIALKDRTKALVNELDHHMLVAMKHPLIVAEEVGRNVRLRFREKEWSFPREDCVLLPIENTTAELLAKWLAGRLLDDLRTQHRFTPTMMRVEVDETTAQTALYEWRGQ